VLAYTRQLYFDFTGYSDMANGAARCFGIRFPMNFFSPCKSTSIIEFWRRWHMTLSRFLRDYLYIPLGGNRRGRGRRYGNLLITMLLGGLGHGANWTFGLGRAIKRHDLQFQRKGKPTARGAARSERKYLRGVCEFL
jgi:alginate O-acetyltransferase complex protein AlgI